MADSILAGDVGGTKTDLALYALDPAPRLLREASFASRDHAGLEPILRAFLGEKDESLVSAAFGIAGAVLDDEVMTPNLPWRVRGAGIRQALGCERVRLMNDLETTAYGALFLPAERIFTLQEGVARPGNIGVIAAGTGLGKAFLFWDGERHHPSAGEGGHVDFAPRDEIEWQLLRHLRTRFDRVSVERVVSGQGLVNVFRFLDEELGRPVAAEMRARLAREDPGAVIGRAALDGSCKVAEEAVDVFVSLYGAAAGNLALMAKATGGIFVGGGIVIKLLPKIRSGAFLRSFVDKGRYSGMLAEVPIRILLDAKTSRLGAAHAAADLVRTAA